MPACRYALLLLNRLAAPTDTSLAEETDEIMDLFLEGLIPTQGPVGQKESEIRIKVSGSDIRREK